ncbi:MAG: adenine methyltransferase [Rudaea sp.]|uniref:DNA N-6-adenine-methyltransferase n=1 Tax=unclassified Rudaea TaxID=2627037 RepID=UPI0010F8B0C0|nr:MULTISPECIES: DNA N-6-adenine-methyltransferase [unclassified Rudaea]MBN8884430.1 adenine methyltransferase [Rudaea sp.]
MSALTVPLRNPNATTTTTWLTPRSLIEALGPFDLDPATPESGMPWRTATRMLRPSDNGLTTPWPKESFVFHNPPYGKGMGEWMAKAAQHGNGITLIFARTETGYFHQNVFRHPNTTAIFFFASRLKFSDADGLEKNAAVSPSVAIAYGEKARGRLVAAVNAGTIEGRLILLGTDQAGVWQKGAKSRSRKKAA